MAQATAQAAAADSSAVAGPADVSPKATTGSEESGPAATLAWLTSFNLERKVLLQLISLKPRVVNAAGSGVFSGECKDIAVVDASPYSTIRTVLQSSSLPTPATFLH